MTVDRSEYTQWEIVASDGTCLCSAETPEAAVARYRQALLELEWGWTELERLGRPPRRKTYDVAGIRERRTITTVIVGDVQAIPLEVPDGVTAL